ncbi:type II toxin-antitoxin system RelB/DinJ family antitoxin [Atopobium sp. oral taxon 416]|uniref:type II toxin-antitoxin system RelB/DinJ family antitoxin n=1 Tax=Atopobium sp. oral taxon 416 TaxID=712157 RepID=UPI001BA7BAFD|nr:type II toxin-antitoxin system RelB/DinJ family antitoxin [Atopobium sp. oral taxon 416]QUC03553.1 type II toxin-antitoxin system RelB/DinJ family antitoxin [Atopobium sp. oral taxon 416]
MASTVMVNIRMDPETKKGMEETCRDLGMSMTTAFVIYARKVAREHRIPFEVSVDPFYSDENQAHLRQAKVDLDAGHSIVHELAADDGAE